MDLQFLRSALPNLSKCPTYEFDFIDWNGPFEGKPFVGVTSNASAEFDLRGPAVDGRANEEVVEEQKPALLRPRHEAGRVELELGHVILTKQKSISGLLTNLRSVSAGDCSVLRVGGCVSSRKLGRLWRGKFA